MYFFLWWLIFFFNLHALLSKVAYLFILSFIIETLKSLYLVVSHCLSTALRFQIASVHNLISALRYTSLQFLNFDTLARSVNFKQCDSSTSQPTLGQISGPCLHIFSFEFVLKLNFNFNFIGLSLRSWWFIFSLIWFCPCIYIGVYFDPH